MRDRLLACALLVLAASCEKDPPRTDPPTPAPVPVPVPPGPRDAATISNESGCDSIAVEVTDRGLWVGAPPDLRCYAPRTPDDKQNLSWLETTLRRFRAALDPDCHPSFEIAAAGTPKYQDLISAMDTAIKVGFSDVGLAEPAKLAISFTGIDPATALTCTIPTRFVRRHVPDPTPPVPFDPLPLKPKLDAIVIVVTKQDIQVKGKHVIDVAAAIAGGAPIPALAAAIGTSNGRPIVLQADQDTDARLVNNIVLTAKAAGFDNLLFAVKPP